MLRGVMTDEILKQLDARAMAIPADMQDVCAKANVAGSTISRWRKGARPRAKTLTKIYRALDEMEARI
jgi:transcriptional regulator with XRE-family HTH domain